MESAWQLAFVVLVLFVLVEALALVALGRVIGELQIALNLGAAHRAHAAAGLPVGAEAKSVAGHAPGLGRDVTLDLANGGRWIVVFGSTSCSACRELIEDTARAGLDRQLGAGLLFMITGPIEAVTAIGQQLPEATVLVDTDSAAQASYRVDRVPYAFLVEDRKIRKTSFANRAADLVRLAAQSREADLAQPSPSNPLPPLVSGAIPEKEVAP